MSKTIVGMAIKITKDNAEKIAVVNGGIVPEVEEGLYAGTYFIFPYAPDAYCSIVAGYVFKENWRFAKTESHDYFVEIYEI